MQRLVYQVLKKFLNFFYDRKSEMRISFIFKILDCRKFFLYNCKNSIDEAIRCKCWSNYRKCTVFVPLYRVAKLFVRTNLLKGMKSPGERFFGFKRHYKNNIFHVGNWHKILAVVMRENQLNRYLIKLMIFCKTL